MPSPFVLTITALSGDPEGVRIVDRANWIGQAVIFGRADLREAISSNALNTAGIYLLLGSDGGSRQLYIGKAAYDLGERLRRQHVEPRREFWVETIAFVSKAPDHRLGFVDYLEARLIELARTASQVELKNDKGSSAIASSPYHKIDADDFLKEMLRICRTLGVKAFGPWEASAAIRERYVLKGKGANGTGELRSDGFLVHEGSTVRRTPVMSFKGTYFKLRSHLKSEGIIQRSSDGLVFQRDYLFTKPSAAASVLLGRHANGWIEWKAGNGVTLMDSTAASGDA